MAEPKNPHFYDFGAFERALAFQDQLFLSLETPGHLKQIKEKPWNIFKTIIFINLKIWDIRSF